MRKAIKMGKGIMSKPLDVAYQNIRQLLEDARKTAYTAVNFAMVQAYWNIGRLIVEEEQRGRVKAGYGERLIKELARATDEGFWEGFYYLKPQVFQAILPVIFNWPRSA